MTNEQDYYSKPKRRSLLFQIFWKTTKYGFIAVALIVGSLFLSDYIVKKVTADDLYDKKKNIPSNDVGLLLGTGKYLKSGSVNLYYQYRITAAVRLYKAGKIKFILVSGDNGTEDYDEPSDILNDLVASGIPENKIFLDYAGFRTLDSVVRSKKIFGQTSITIISQKFHNERAVMIAKFKGISAVGYNAKDVSHRYGFKTQIREYFARVKMFIDIITFKSPKFLGSKIEIK
ncbi:MAG: SanA protein [Saprospiraceae bacterium]|jgi:SanA protein